MIFERYHQSVDRLLFYAVVNVQGHRGQSPNQGRNPVAKTSEPAGCTHRLTSGGKAGASMGDFQGGGVAEADDRRAAMFRL